MPTHLEIDAMEFENPKTIWLQPWCYDCEGDGKQFDTGRLWAGNDVWGACADCGREAVEYVIGKDKAS